MINAIRHMLSKIHMQIPPEILELAFETKGGRKSIDEVITEKIIEDQLIPDCSAIAGQWKEIVLDPKWVIQSSVDLTNTLTTVPYAIYEVPDYAREYRRIVSVLELSLPFGTSSSMAMVGSMSLDCQYSGVTAGSIGEQAINGVTGVQNFRLPDPLLIAYNKIKLTPMNLSLLSAFALVLRCRLEYDKEFTNLTPDAVIELSELAVAATKAYIYNQMSVKIDMGVMKSGQEIGKIREIIDSYADQIDRYNVLRDEFHGSAEILDHNQMFDRFRLGIFI